MTDKQNILMVFALLALCMPMIGCLFGLIRYKKHGKEIKEKMEKTIQTGTSQRRLVVFVLLRE